MLRIKKIFLGLFLLMIVSVTIVVAAYIPNNRDTLENPKPMTFKPFEFTEDYEEIEGSENKTFRYHFRQSTGVLFITDKRNNYTWKSGIDQALYSDNDEHNYNLLEALNERIENGDFIGVDPVTNKEVFLADQAMQEVEGKLLPVSPMTDAYVNRANSIITLKAYNIRSTSPILDIYHSSAVEPSKVDTAISTDLGYTVLSITYDFSTIEKMKVVNDIQVTVLLHLTEKGLEVEIPDELITGADQNLIATIDIMPFFGATGGALEYPVITAEIDENNPRKSRLESDWSDRVELEMIDGYSFIPDGTGGLVRFRRNSQEFSVIKIPVYGTNPVQNTSFYYHEPLAKFSAIPVYGMAHGYQQNAYVAYAKSGAENMTIRTAPEGAENNVPYNYTSSEFLYNHEFIQIYNQSGNGYTTIRDKRFHYDVHLNFDFLYGDGTNGSYSADYIGMAKTYRDYIFGERQKQEIAYDEIPLRIDFLMSDSQKSLLGSENVIVTNVHDVQEIMEDIRSLGISNMNVGLLGYQKKGLTTGSINKVKWDSTVGKAKEFKKLISHEKDLGVEVSFMQNYYTINEKQISFNGIAAKHISGWYSKTGNSLLPYEIYWGYLQPQKAYDYAKRQINTLARQTGITSTSISGISNNILSHNKQSTTEGIAYYEKLFHELSEKMTVNAVRPNAYLWDSVDRYLNADAFNSQYLAVTDTVPFLSFILKGYMEVFADYSNFSFYDDESMLRMIDYNIYPSFVLTKQSSHYLSRTNSNRYYSTEYRLYKERIDSIYHTVDAALGAVINAEWINRNVLESGIILNTYSNDTDIIINYTNTPYLYHGITVKPMSSEVIRHG